VHIPGKEEHPWRDLKVDAWFTTTMEPPQNPGDNWEIQATGISYYCDIQEAQQFGDLLNLEECLGIGKT
jgi:hypothetical protein